MRHFGRISAVVILLAICLFAPAVPTQAQEDTSPDESTDGEDVTPATGFFKVAIPGSVEIISGEGNEVREYSEGDMVVFSISGQYPDGSWQAKGPDGEVRIRGRDGCNCWTESVEVTDETVKHLTPPEPATTTEITGDFWDDFSGATILGRPAIDTTERAIYLQNGQAHFQAKKSKRADGEWNQSFGVYRVHEDTYYDNLTLEVDVGRISGEGWAGGGADVLFGFKDENNFYCLTLTRTDQWWMMVKLINEVVTNIIPGGDTYRWDKGRTVSNQDITTKQAWDRIKIVVEGTPEGTWIGFYCKDELLGYTIDHDYGGGMIGLGVYTWGNEAHVAFDNLHLSPETKR